jgi:hypothetical protein
MKMEKTDSSVADWICLLYEDAPREELPERLRALIKRLEEHAPRGGSP